ncbi:MAG TPA: response regulator [Rhizomicrobium sp.]|nr:response regulator [Rhizomicrobium sp.]
MPRSGRLRLSRETRQYRAASHDAAHVAASVRHEMIEHEKVNILLVDDQPAKLLSYEVVLRDLGENLIQASSATDALQILLKNEIAVVLVDVCMPDLDGFELAAMIREHPRFQRTAIIFISAIHLSETDYLRGYEMGAVDYVPVPVVPELLRAKVRVFAELYRKTRQLEQLNRELELRVAERTAELKASAARLQESEHQLRLATDAAEIGLWDVDIVGGTLFWPPRVKAMFGISPDVPVSMDDFYAGMHPDDTAATSAAYAAACDPAQRALYDVEYRTIGREDGVIRWVAAKGRAIFDADGKCVRVIGTAMDITTRKQAEERQLLLAREVDHRARNALAVVQSIVRLTRSTSKEGYVKAVEGRIQALAQAHTLLSESRWQGADVRRLILEEIAPYRGADPARVQIDGPSVSLLPERSQSLALVLHELATNSVKYGALSVPDGTLSIRWALADGVLILRWTEAGGPLVVPPKSHGFGTKIMNASIKHQIGGNVAWDWRPTGLECTLQIPLGGSNAASSADAENLVHLPSGKMKRILLVEDEAMIGIMMRELLTEYGVFVVGPCCSLQEAMNEASGEFDGAILDLNLAGEFVYPVASLLSNRNVPFVFVTGYGDESLDARFDGSPILQKPITRDSLESHLSRMFGAAVQRTPSNNAMPGPASQSLKTA